MTSNVHSQTASSKLDLFLINATSPICDFNNSIFSDKNKNISLCLDDAYGYSCAPNDTNNSMSLGCSLTNDNTQCHSFAISESNSYNYSLDCFYRQLNTTLIGNQFNLKHVNECLYGINSPTHNNSLYVCALFQPLITVTTFNNTNVYQQSSNDQFPLFGFEVNKNVLKRYAVPIIVGIIVVFCLLVLCCYGMCRLCFPKMQMRRRQRNSRCNQNTKMPQTSVACNI